MRKGSYSFLILLTGLLLFSLSSCGKKTSQEESPSGKSPLSSKEYDMSLFLPEGKSLVYDLEIPGRGGVIFSPGNPDKQDRMDHEDHSRTEVVIEKTGDNSFKADWVQAAGDGKEKSIIASLDMDRNGNSPSGERRDFYEIFQVLFPRPENPVKAGQAWKRSLDTPAGDRGFVQGKIVGVEKVEGENRLRIESRYDILKERKGSFIRMEGKGVLYYSVSRRAYTGGEVSFSIQAEDSSESGQSGEDKTGHVRIEWAGDFKITLSEKQKE